MSGRVGLYRTAVVVGLRAVGSCTDDRGHRGPGAGAGDDHDANNDRAAVDHHPPRPPRAAQLAPDGSLVVAGYELGAPTVWTVPADALN